MQREVLYLSPTYPGSVHDKKICDEESLRFEKKTNVFVDLGFVGLTSEIAHIIVPHKQRKNSKLNEKEKENNKWCGKIRVRVEHAIAGIKIFRKVKDRYRGRMEYREDTIMLVACSLHNLKQKLKYAS